jgi:hypothetical protein
MSPSPCRCGPITTSDYNFSRSSRESRSGYCCGSGSRLSLSGGYLTKRGKSSVRRATARSAFQPRCANSAASTPWMMVIPPWPALWIVFATPLLKTRAGTRFIAPGRAALVMANPPPPQIAATRRIRYEGSSRTLRHKRLRSCRRSRAGRASLWVGSAFKSGALPSGCPHFATDAPSHRGN